VRKDKVIFLDRDGVINRDLNSYVTSWDKIEFIQGAFEALRKLYEHGYKVIIVSNQAGVSRGDFTKKQLNCINKRMLKEIRKHGARIYSVQYCIHRDEDNCNCRKPKTALYLKGIRGLRVDLSDTFCIGDQERDMVAGKALGCKTIFVESGKHAKNVTETWSVRPDIVRKDLLESVDYILNKQKIDILITYATAGVGHKKAAESIKQAFDSIAKNNENIKLIDVLDYCSPLFKWMYPRTYIVLVKYIPTIWGICYYILDSRIVYFFVKPIRRFINWINSIGFIKFLKTENPKIIVTTHFFSTEVIGEMKRKNLIDSTFITCLTDFRMHKVWFSSGCDYYIVPSQEARCDLVKSGFSAEKIKVLGIPVEPKFEQTKDINSLIKKFGLENKFTVLITSGGFGVGPILEMMSALYQLPVQILVICGKNPSLYKKANDIIRKKQITNVKIYEFVNNIDEFMQVSSVLIGKTGGLYSSEALSKNLPIIAISSIPGQEIRNRTYLIKNNAAVLAKNVGCLKKAVEYVMENNHLNSMISAIKKIKRENASLEIAKLALTALKQGLSNE